MKTFNGYILVDEVPDGAKDFEIHPPRQWIKDAVPSLSFWDPVNGFDNDNPDLPPGRYEIVGLVKDLTRTQKMTISGKGTAAFNSLIQSLNLKGNVLIIKIMEPKRNKEVIDT